jgi:hypothetical protein
MNKIRAILFSVSTLFVSASIHAAPPVPTGLFYLPSGRSLSGPALNNQNVDGVVVGASWSDLEPSEGNYVFDTVANGQSLDQLVAAVEAVGKPMRLSINTGGPGVSGDGPKTVGGSKPDWLITKIANDSYTGDKFFTYVDSKTPQGENITAKIPVFWEPTLLNKHRLLVQAIANHLAGHPLVKIVFVPYANADTNDWNLGDTSPNPDGLGSNPQQRWLDALVNSGYATMADALIDAGNKTYRAYHTAFPNKILTTSIGRLQNDVLNPGGADVNGRNISETVVSNAAAAWPGYIVAQKNNLNGGGVPPAQQSGDSAWNDLYILHTNYGIPTAAQMVWHAYDDCEETMDQWSAERMNMGNDSDCEDSTQMLYQAVNLGITYETKWQELYELDILNLSNTNADPHLPAGVPRNVIGYAHQHLF